MVLAYGYDVPCVQDEALLLLYYFVVVFWRLCLLEGNWLFVFGHCNFYFRNCAFIDVVILFVCSKLHLSFFFLFF